MAFNKDSIDRYNKELHEYVNATLNHLGFEENSLTNDFVLLLNDFGKGDIKPSEAIDKMFASGMSYQVVYLLILKYTQLKPGTRSTKLIFRYNEMEEWGYSKAYLDKVVKSDMEKLIT